MMSNCVKKSDHDRHLADITDSFPSRRMRPHMSHLRDWRDFNSESTKTTINTLQPLTCATNLELAPKTTTYWLFCGQHTVTQQTPND